MKLIMLLLLFGLVFSVYSAPSTYPVLFSTIYIIFEDIFVIDIGIIIALKSVYLNQSIFFGIGGSCE